MTSSAATTSSKRRTLRRFRWLILYILTLAASHAYLASRNQPATPSTLQPNQHVIDIPAMDERSAIPGTTTRLSYFDTPASPPHVSANASSSDSANSPTTIARPPIVLIHGSPGSASDFDKLAPKFAHAGYRVIAIDLPGFGDSSRRVPSYSILSHAHAVLALLDALHLPRAHLIGWSMGGGVVLHLADFAPDRVASLTLMAAIGSQENEGSRSYFFEHMKYRAGFAVFVGVPNLIPHFGILPEPRSTISYSWLRNFDDTDMRPLRGIMQRLHTPTLVLHGRRDFLVPDWAAEDHASCIQDSRLVMLDAMHFLPFMQVDETARHILEFTVHHDTPGVSPLSERLIEASPRAHATGILGVWTEYLRAIPWWVIVLVIAAISLRHPNCAIVVAAALAAQIRIDPVVGAMGAITGRLLTPLLGFIAASQPHILRRVFGAEPHVSLVDWTRRFNRTPPGFWLGLIAAMRPDRRLVAPRAVRLVDRSLLNRVLFAFGTTVGVLLVVFVQYMPALVLSMIANQVLRLDYEVETTGDWLVRFFSFIASCAAIYPIVSAIPLLLTWTGRRMLLASLRRAVYSEYWPTKVFYTPLAPYYAWLMIRTRRAVPYTACNPGLSGHGGMIGESKHQIQSRLDAATGCVLPTALIDAGTDPRARAAAAIQAIESNPSLGGYPIIIKPDSGFRGFSVKLIRSPNEFESYFEAMLDAAIVQKYHAGPHEVGVMWIRRVRPAAYHPLPEGGGRGEGSSALGLPKSHRLSTTLGKRNGSSSSENSQNPIAPGCLPTLPNSISHSNQNLGFIYSITRKEFPYITGDGRRTLEQLIYRHPRLRCQASVFLSRFADEASRILAAGERIRLVQSGNHCQGTLFLDGTDLITPELERAIDQLASTFGDETRGSEKREGSELGGGLDVGRFDLRFESFDDLKVGRNFSVIELNGTTGESTNVYDPSKSIVWRYGVLFGLWKHLFELGSWRARQGVPTMPVFHLFGSLRSFFRSRSGSELAD